MTSRCLPDARKYQSVLERRVWCIGFISPLSLL
jgi:hypothetical protein